MMPLNTVLFPGMPMPLSIFEDRYKRMVSDCLEHGSPFGIALIKSGPEVGGLAEPHLVGTSAEIIHADESAVGEHIGRSIIVIGRDRFRVEELRPEGDLLRARVAILTPTEGDLRASRELCEELGVLLQEHVATLMAAAGMPVSELELPADPARLSFMVSAHVTRSVQARQQLLETRSASERLLAAREMLREETGEYRMLLSSMEVAERHQVTEGNAPPGHSPN